MRFGDAASAHGALLALALLAPALRAQGRADLGGMSLDSLLRIPVSTASRYQQTEAEAPSSVTILTASDIRRVGYRSLAEVLAAVRGFYVASDRNYDYVGVRGFGRPTDYNNRMLLSLNGHPINDGFYGFAPVGTDLGLDLEAIERIEIVRGPGSSLFGPNAMFAIVNVVTRTGPSLHGAELHEELGSFGTHRTWGMAGGSIGDVASYHVSGELASSDGETLYFPEYDAPSTHNGVARGLDGDRHGNIFTQLQVGGLSLEARATSRTKQIPTGAWGTLFGEPGSQTLDE